MYHMSDYNFIKHTDVGKRFEERITITRSNHIGFPTQFYKDNDVANFKYTVLFYDKTSNAIGVKFTNEQEAGAITIAGHNKGYGGYISATSFFRANRINTKKFAGRYEYKKVTLSDVGFEEAGVIFVLELQERQEKEVVSDSNI